MFGSFSLHRPVIIDLGILCTSPGSLPLKMLAQLRYQIQKGRQILTFGVGLAGTISAAVAFGFFEAPEIHVLDRFLKMRSSDNYSDERILVVTIGEDDISSVGSWPIPDGALAELLQRIDEHQPASIGIDLYRNLPVAPGSDELVKTFESNYNVIGIERSVGEVVGPHPTLLELGQSGASDLVLDDDGKIRRGLLSVMKSDDTAQQTLASVLVLDYLYAQGIEPEPLDKRGSLLQLGKGRVRRFEQNDGSYVNADEGGFQVLMNYRRSFESFDSISMSAVLAGELTDERVQGRIVLIGSVAVSTNDWFSTPVGGDQVAGVYIHAHMISQLLALALDGKPLLRTLPAYVDFFWTMLWMATSVAVSRSVLYSRSLKSRVPAWQLSARLLGLSGGLGSVSYGLFVIGWWLPVALPMVSMIAVVLLGVVYRNQQLQNLAAFDELTQVANRRYFDQHLAESIKVSKQLSLILCDVDYFKPFNDLYGHPAGDRCLQQVAHALRLAVRDTDLVARYGGEEFVVVLPGADSETAALVAARIQQQVGQLEIAHEGSQVNQWVTLSFGVASVVSPDFVLPPLRLIEYADQALYEAKQAGRNRVMISQWQNIESKETHPNEIA